MYWFMILAVISRGLSIMGIFCVRYTGNNSVDYVLELLIRVVSQNIRKLIIVSTERDNIFVV